MMIWALSAVMMGLSMTTRSPKCEQGLADAIVDRILERGRLLRLDGPAVRTKHLSGDELAGETQDDADRRRISGIDAAEFPEPTPSRYAEADGPLSFAARCTAPKARTDSVTGDQSELA